MNDNDTSAPRRSGWSNPVMWLVVGLPLLSIVAGVGLVVIATRAGGGDTVSALAHAGVKEQFTYVSTAGGAFLEWMEGKPLPGVEALKTA